MLVPPTVPLTVVQARYDTVCTPLTLESGPGRVVLVSAARASDAVRETFTATLLALLSTSPGQQLAQQQAPAPPPPEPITHMADTAVTDHHH